MSLRESSIDSIKVGVGMGVLFLLYIRTVYIFNRTVNARVLVRILLNVMRG